MEEHYTIRNDTRIASLLANLSEPLVTQSRLAERICKAVAERFFPQHSFFFTALGALHNVGDLVFGVRPRNSDEERTIALRAGYLFLKNVHPDLADLVLHQENLEKYANDEIEFPDSTDYPRETRILDVIGQKFSDTYMMVYLDCAEKKMLGLVMTIIKRMIERRPISEALVQKLTDKFPRFLELQQFISELLSTA